MCANHKETINNTQTCNISVPTGHIIVNSRWQGHELTKELQASIPVHLESSLSVIDFHPASNAGVIYIFESDVIEGQAYKRRAARLRKANRLRGVVLVEKTDMSSQYFQCLQKFCVSDLGLNLIPVANQIEAAAFLVQMGGYALGSKELFIQRTIKNDRAGSLSLSCTVVLSVCESIVGDVYAETTLQKNPFVTNPKPVSKGLSLLNTLTTVPGLGDTKARVLVDKFSSFLILCQASQEDLSEVIGKASAAKLYSFLHGCS